MTLEWDARGGGQLLTSLHSAGLQITAKRTAEALKEWGYRSQGLAWSRPQAWLW
jgi:hypothetical protein